MCALLAQILDESVGEVFVPCHASGWRKPSIGGPVCESAGGPGALSETYNAPQKILDESAKKFTVKFYYNASDRIFSIYGTRPFAHTMAIKFLTNSLVSCASAIGNSCGTVLHLQTSSDKTILTSKDKVYVGERIPDIAGEIRRRLQRTLTESAYPIRAEVGLSQPYSELLEGAAEYLGGTDGQVRVVFLVKVEREPVTVRFECWTR
jgi:hypothetical protein